MIKEVLSQFSLTILPVIGVLLFLTVFLGMLIWITRPKSSKFYTELSQLALHDGLQKENEK